MASFKLPNAYHLALYEKSVLAPELKLETAAPSGEALQVGLANLPLSSPFTGF